jgi:hypothetical protein
LSIPVGRIVQGVFPSPDGARLAVLLAGDRAVRVWNMERLRQRLDELGLE